MARRWLTLALIIALLVASSGSVTADNGPHTGDFSTTTDACAGRHRAHRGQGEKLLKGFSQLNLCFSCHGSVATDADTNVEDGIYLERDPVTESLAEGTVNRGLRGGGFVHVTVAASSSTTWSGA